MNVNKVWFYIAALSIIIGGVWASLPNESQRQQMRQAAEKRKAERKAKQQPAASAVQAASAAAPK